jgi:hypothetical protein
MDDRNRPRSRTDLLAYLECHWRELSLSEARSLSVERVDPAERPTVSINPALSGP